MTPMDILARLEALEHELRQESVNSFQNGYKHNGFYERCDRCDNDVWIGPEGYHGRTNDHVEIEKDADALRFAIKVYKFSLLRHMFGDG